MRTQRGIGILFVGLALTALTAPSARAAPPDVFTMDVSPEVGSIDDTFTVTIRIEIAGISGSERFWDPDFRDFKVLDSQTQVSTSSQMDPQLGQRLKTIETRRYVLQAKRVGRLTIDEAKVRIAGEEYETKPARVLVVMAGSALPSSLPDEPDPTGGTHGGVPGFRRPSSRLSGDDVFIHAVVDKKKPYVGEQVTVTWMLYTRTEVLKFEPEPPRLDNLFSEILYEPDAYFTYHDDRVGRTPYVVAVVSKRAIFPTVAGKIEIQPFRARVATLSTPLSDSEEVSSRSLELDVKPLPDGAPPNFDPTYVGEFTASASVDRERIAASEALTLTLTMSGAGGIRRTNPPVFEVEGFRFEKPVDFQENIDLSGNVVTGERTYRYWTTPTEGGELTIPSLDIPYFNPQTATYELARTDPMMVRIEGDPKALAIVDTGDGRENVIERDIRLSREGDSIESRAIVQLHRTSWFWVLALLPGLIFVIVVTVDRIRQGLKKETPRSRLRRARGRARRRFRVAEIHLRGNRPAKFFGELSKVVNDHIEECVGRPIQSMTRDEMTRFLSEQGFDSGTIKAITENLESFDFARFSPTASGPGEMRAALRKTKELVRRIERTRVRDGEEDAA